MSSFVKLKKENTPEIPGVKMSIRNCQICSTGSDSFDFVIGGGIELNSLIMIGEDKFGRYSDILTKLYLADGFHYNHRIYLASLDEDPMKIMKDIPMPHEIQKEAPTEAASNDLRIAFRYQDLPKIDSTQRGYQSGILYDLNKKYEKYVIENFGKISTFSFEKLQQQQSKGPFESIIEDLKEIVKTDTDNLLRICINSVGSPLWYTENFSSELLKFLVQLKSIVRYSNAVCFVTMPLHLISQIDDSLIYKIRRLVDSNINLESFNNIGKQTNAVFKQYNGLLHIKKLQTIAALQSHKPEAFDLAFKLKTHKFIIEKLHLPPELQESDSNEITMSCSSSGGNKSLDF